MFAIRVEYTRWAGQAEESAPQARRPRGRRPLTSMIVDLPSTRFSTFGCGERCTPSLTSLLYASDDSSKYAVVESASPLASASLPQEALRGCCPCAFAIRSPTRRRSSATAAQLPTHTQSILSAGCLLLSLVSQFFRSTLSQVRLLTRDPPREESSGPVSAHYRTL